MASPHPDVIELLGIPFARAERFGPPVAVDVSLDGGSDHDAWGPVAPQPPGDLFMGVDLPQSEDCLSLNVWTPGRTGRRPVMVWIHGGGFRTGGGSHDLSRGARLAAQGDVVVVTFNYRLGALGFLAHPDLPQPNLGLLDQVAALRWVRDHAAEVGGDPDQVMLFGESAGAAAVSLLLTAPAARGLIHRAAIQSGAALTTTPDGAAALAEEVAAAAGVPAVADLASLSVAALLDAQTAVEARHGGMPFVPVLDGDVIPGDPIDALRRGVASSVPTVVGTNLDEWRLLAMGDTRRTELTFDRVAGRIARSLGGDAERAGALVDEVRAIRAARGASAEPVDVWCAIETERTFRIPSARLADALTEGGTPTWSYLFEWPSPAEDGWLGACHVLDVPFVFGWPGRADIAWFTGTGPEADLLAAQMGAAWTAHARHGDPSTDEVPWPRHDPSTRPTVVFGRRTRVEHAPWDDQRSAVARALGAG